MKQKLMVLAFIAGLGWLIEACFCESSKYPYYDFGKLSLRYDKAIVQPDTLYGFFVYPDSFSYLASVYQPVLTTPAFGTSCPTPGELGAKYGVVQVDVLANKDFNDTLKAGSSLSSLFQRLSDGAALNQISGTNGIAPEYFYFIYTPYLPKDTSASFDITIRMAKANQDTVESTISGVKFRH